jgi:hypothetical protein
VCCSGQCSSSPVSPNSSIVISQVYGGGGRFQSTYKCDFVELFNRGTFAVNLAGWALQDASETGSFTSNSANQMTPLSGTILPGQYFLVAEACGTGNNLPTQSLSPADTTPFSVGRSGGKIALVRSLLNNCGGFRNRCTTSPNSTSIVDFVGWGTAATDYEGTGAALAAQGDTTAMLRKRVWCDSNSNYADFALGTPTPRNN